MRVDAVALHDELRVALQVAVPTVHIECVAAIVRGRSLS